jgi:leucyl aminopeptidase
MADGPTVGFSAFSLPSSGVLVVFCDDGLRLGPATRRLLGPAAALVARAAAADRFKGKSGSSLDLVAPADLKVARLVVLGCG